MVKARERKLMKISRFLLIEENQFDKMDKTEK